MKHAFLFKVVPPFLVAMFFMCAALPDVGGQLRSPTELALWPTTFSCVPGGSEILTAVLTCNGHALAGKLIGFAATPGTVSPNSTTTDLEGKVTAAYVAPQVGVGTPVVIIASFLGDRIYESSSAISSGTIQAEPFFPTSVRGAAFILPNSTSADVSNYTKNIPQDVRRMVPLPIPSTGFLLAMKESVYLVLASQCGKGLADVNGWELLDRPIELGDMNLNVIVAEDVSFNKTGIPATVGEILANPGDYEFKLVKVDAFRRQVSFLYDPDDGSGVLVPVVAGYLTEKPQLFPEPAREAIEEGRDLTRNPSRSFVKEVLHPSEGSRLPVFNLEACDYWWSCQAETNGIVLLPGSHVLELLRRIVPKIGELIQVENLPVLYDIETNRSGCLEVSSAKEAKDHMNEVIRLRADACGEEVSVQESVKDATGERISVDVRLEGLVAWSGLSFPPKEEELLAVVGASNIHQDEAWRDTDGEFMFVGRVVSANEIDGSLPVDTPILVVYYRERRGEADYGMSANQVKEEIENRLDELSVNRSIVPPATVTSTATSMTATATTQTSLTFTEMKTETTEQATATSHLTTWTAIDRSIDRSTPTYWTFLMIVVAPTALVIVVVAALLLRKARSKARSFGPSDARQSINARVRDRDGLRRAPCDERNLPEEPGETLSDSALVESADIENKEVMTLKDVFDRMRPGPSREQISRAVESGFLSWDNPYDEVTYQILRAVIDGADKEEKTD